MASRRGSFVSINLKSSRRNCLKASSLPSFTVNVLITINGAVMLTPFCSVGFGSAWHPCASLGEVSGRLASPPFSSPTARDFGGLELTSRGTSSVRCSCRLRAPYGVMPRDLYTNSVLLHEHEADAGQVSLTANLY